MKNTGTSRAGKRPSGAGLARAMAQAEAHCAQRKERLTEMRREVYAALLEQPHHPLSAYDLLERLQQRQGRKLAPLTIYRALEFLLRNGLVHRLESSHAFVACSHPDEAHEAIYLVCNACGVAEELELAPLEGLLRTLAQQRGFAAARQIVEVQGTCRECHC